MDAVLGEPTGHAPPAGAAAEALMQGTEIWRFMHRGKPILRHPRGRFKADNGEALLAAALAGLGVAALPDFMIEAHVASGALAAVLTGYPPPDAGLYVVRPPGDFPPRKVRVLTDILLEYFGTDQSRAGIERSSHTSSHLPPKPSVRSP
jgi:DNA-binding transcriptional LysR family regulator